MSRLDKHVAAVQNRMATMQFIRALAWLSVSLASAVLVVVLMDRIFLLSLPHKMLWLEGGIAAVVVGALAHAIYSRPDPRQAAIPIDQKLGLQEKISTALYMRDEQDAFSKAAVTDAEETARNVVVNLSQHFPLSFPRPAFAAVALIIVAMLSNRFIEPMDLFNRREIKAQQLAQKEEGDRAKREVEKAISFVAALPPALADNDAIKLAKAELSAMLDKAPNDPAKANRTAVKALADVNEALKEQLQQNKKYAEAQNQMKLFRSMQQPAEGAGPVADAQRSIMKGDFDKALDDLSKVVEKFDTMDKADQQKAADQMQQMAQQLQQQANNPQEQKKMEQQLQQMGMNQQQAQQAQQLMQQAAQGNQQAQQQLQQMAQQAQQQMNNGQGPNQQQQQQMQQMMQQMQAQANAQQQAQQMSQAAQQMAAAMQQAAQAQGGGQQQGSQQGQANSQQMNGAMGSMQQQLQQMQAMQQDAKQVAAAQQQAAAAAQQAQHAMNCTDPNCVQCQGGGFIPNGQIAGQNKGEWTGQNGFAGPNQGGQAMGDRNYKEQAPYGVKQETSQSQDDEKGRILASTFIKDNQPLKGQSVEVPRDVAERAFNEQTDEIDEERVGRQAQQAVKNYFKTLSPEAK
jgi:chemotaxis protein histidine kinase CheA